MQASRERGTAAVRAYSVALRMAEALFSAYRQENGKSFSSVAVANSARYHLADYAALADWLEAQVISPPLFLRAQVATLGKFVKQIQVRGLRTEKALSRYEKWLLAEGAKFYTAADAIGKFQAMTDNAAYRLTLSEALRNFSAGKDYVRTVTARTGMTESAVIFLEAWHLPSAYLVGMPEAVSLCESG